MLSRLSTDPEWGRPCSAHVASKKEIRVREPVGLPSLADRCWQVLLQVGYHSAAAKSIEIVVRIGEDSWAQQAHAFELFGTVLDLTGGVDGGELMRVGRG